MHEARRTSTDSGHRSRRSRYLYVHPRAPYRNGSFNLYAAHGNNDAGAGNVRTPGVGRTDGAGDRPSGASAGAFPRGGKIWEWSAHGGSRAREARLCGEPLFSKLRLCGCFRHDTGKRSP